MRGSWDDEAVYCPICAERLEEREIDGAVRKACSACSYISFRSPACAAVTLVVRGREILMVRRGIEPYRGCWGLPGGFQDYWESPAEAARREVREETGLEVRIERILDVCYTTDDPRKRSNAVVFLGRPVAGELCAGDDAVEVRYFLLDDLPEEIAFESSRAILHRIAEDHPKGDIV